jgi:hypothetical protein
MYYKNNIIVGLNDPRHPLTHNPLEASYNLVVDKSQFWCKNSHLFSPLPPFSPFYLLPSYFLHTCHLLPVISNLPTLLFGIVAKI